jgi:hypothetical protein
MAFKPALKLKVKRRAHFQCCLCHALGVEVHHVVPTEYGGPDTEDNAAPVCPTCHETYGANPLKRKFIREARDFWFEICAKRFAGDKDILDRIAKQTETVATKKDLDGAVQKILGMSEVKRRALSEDQEEPKPRSQLEVLEAIEQFFDKIWYDRHQGFMQRVASGKATTPVDIIDVAKRAARGVEKKYGKRNLGPHSAFDWGMLNGKLSALRWVLGDEWDMLDT